MQKVALREFQRTFIRRALSPDIDTAAISMPRSGGKTFLCSHIVSRALNPSDPMYQEGREVVLISGSLAQARFAYKFIKAELEPQGVYRWNSSTTAVGAKDPKSGTELRCLSSNPKTALGMVGVSFVILDEPGSYEVTGGQDLWDAVTTAQGKPGSKMRILLAGTRAPAKPGSWWLELLDKGSHGSTYVQQLVGDSERWDNWNEIRRVNPLSVIDAGFRRKLLEERDEARKDDRLKARFMSFRLNRESVNETAMLFSVDEWRRCEARELGSDEGAPIVGVDLGAGRAWSAATALYGSGRLEAFAVCAGIPDIETQTKRDLQPRGSYQRIVDDGSLLIDTGRHIPRVAFVVDEILRRWPLTEFAICDRFRLPELLDAFAGRVHVVPRVTQWSSASEDIRAIRELALDGMLSVARASRSLMRMSLYAAVLQHDTSGNCRLIKRGSNGTDRDDVAHALVLAGGALARMSSMEPAKVYSF